MSTTVNSRADGRAVDELRPVTITLSLIHI